MAHGTIERTDDGQRPPKREPVSRARVLQVAMVVADHDGIAAVTMREVADRLGVEAMALYRHVANKDELLDGLVDSVVAEINDACAGLPAVADRTAWRSVVRQRILTARGVVQRHPWAPQLIGARGTLSASLMDYYEALTAAMVAGGCSIDLVHHGMHALGTRALGFSAELFAPGGPAELDAEATSDMIAELSRRLPTIARVVASMAHDPESTLGWCDDQFEFEFGLDIVLDGLEARRLRQAAASDG